MKLFKSKKGSIQDLLFIMVVLLLIGVTTLIVFKVSNELNTKLQESTDVNDRGKAAYSQINGFYPGVLDNMFLILVIGLSVGALVLAMLVRIHPVFLVGFILISVIIFFLAGIFSNIYLEIANQPEMQDVATQLTFTTHIIGKLPLIIAVIGTILSIVMYKLWSADQ